MSNNITNTVLADLKQFTYEAALTMDSSEKEAKSCASSAIKSITLNFKNRLMYIPLMDASKRIKEYEAIQAEFNGSNHAELALKYKRSLQFIYNILKSKEPAKTKRPITIQIIEDYLPPEFIRSGLSEENAGFLAKKIAKHLQQTYPGVSIYARAANNFL